MWTPCTLGAPISVGMMCLIACTYRIFVLHRIFMEIFQAIFNISTSIWGPMIRYTLISLLIVFRCHTSPFKKANHTEKPFFFALFTQCECGRISSMWKETLKLREVSKGLRKAAVMVPCSTKYKCDRDTDFMLPSIHSLFYPINITIISGLKFILKTCFVKVQTKYKVLLLK